MKQVSSWGPWLAVVALGSFWLVLIYQLGAQWTVYEQYHYGWSVPFLCAYLIWQRMRADATTGPKAHSTTGLVPERSRGPVVPWSRGPLLLLALLWLPTRVLHEANPVWRLTSLALTLEVVALTLLLIRFAFGPARFAQFAFPIGFFLVAVPWPSAVEEIVVQSLTRLNVASTVEVLGWLGVPALQRGNVIEISSGLVGIDEACSGIRSFQASLMIALFLGELYRLSFVRRILFCLTGFVLAFLFNVARTLLLTWVASTDGVSAMTKWHDPAGIGVLVACFVSLWAVGVWMRKDNRTTDHRTTGLRNDGSAKPVVPWSCGSVVPLSDGPVVRWSGSPVVPWSRSPAMLLSLAVWVILVEAGTELWFRAHEGAKQDASAWSIAWPSASAGFKRVELTERVRSQLLYDEGAAGSWSNDDGSQWQMFYLRWFPARSLSQRVKVHLTKTHTPEICLEAAGMKLREEQGTSVLHVKGLSLAFHQYVFDAAGKRLDVFFAVSEDSGTDMMAANLRRDSWQRIQAALAGSRNYGQRTLEIAIAGYANAQEAEAALQSQLEQVIVVADHGNTGPRDQ